MGQGPLEFPRSARQPRLAQSKLFPLSGFCYKGDAGCGYNDDILFMCSVFLTTNMVLNSIFSSPELKAQW